MYKKIILICIGVLVVMSATAQVTVNRGNYGPSQSARPLLPDNDIPFVMKYGIKAGLNMTTMSNKMTFDPDFGMGMGFRVGGFLNLRWGQRTENSLPGTGLIGFQPEIMYSNNGVKTCAGNLIMNFLSAPLMLKVYPTTGFNLEVGPEFSYLLMTSPDTMALDGAQVNVGECSGLMVGVAAGIAYDFTEGFTIGARYTYYLTDMAKNILWKPGNIQVTVGCMF